MQLIPLVFFVSGPFVQPPVWRLAIFSALQESLRMPIRKDNVQGNCKVQANYLWIISRILGG
ncbi:MAG: hypothetical protein Q7J21_03560, partial [Rugosibacter sp.]|nr:hypothetical protein [Rugosibacter sp.]